MLYGSLSQKVKNSQKPYNPLEKEGGCGINGHSRHCPRGNVYNTLLPVLRPYLCFYMLSGCKAFVWHLLCPDI